MSVTSASTSATARASASGQRASIVRTFSIA
jgi:hypothetical protein